MSIGKSIVFRKILLLLIGLLGGSLCYHFVFSSWLMIFVLLFTILSFYFSNISIKNKSIPKLIPFLVLFLLYTIAWFRSYTNDLHLDDLGKKSLFFFIPLIVAVSNIKINELKFILKIGLYSVAIAMLLLLTRAFALFLYTNEYAHLIFNGLSPWVHTTYMAITICFYLGAAFYLYKSKEISTTILYIFSFIAFVFTFLLSSRGGFLTFIIISIYLAYIHWGIIKASLFGLSLSIIILLAVLYIPNVNERYRHLKESITENRANESGESRIKVWKISIELLKVKPILGYGITHNNSLLNNEYNKTNDLILITKRYNAHNQFLETALSTGLLGLLALFYWLFSIWTVKTTEIKILATILTGILLLNFMFESLLERQNGIIFSILFSALLIFVTPNERKSEHS